MKKIVIFILLCLFVFESMSISMVAAGNNAPEVWGNSADTKWYDESKIEYQLQTAADLAGLSALVQSGVTFEGKTIKLCNNICLNSYSNWANWDDSMQSLNIWTPIGSSEKPFKGVFDGQGCSVAGMYISSSINDVGLFGHVEYATIKNINVVYAYVSGLSNVGSICGYAYESDFSHCHSEANVVGNGAVGGMFGYITRGENSSARYIRDCSSTGSVLNNVKFESSDSHYMTTNAVGGIVGTYSSREKGDIAVIEKCANYTIVRGTSCVGGVVGKLQTYYTQNITVKDCYNEGNVKSDDQHAGGIIGYNYQDGSLGSSNSVTIERCVNYGDVSSDDNEKLGGILGFAHICRQNTSCEINNCYNINSINVIRGAYSEKYGDKVQVNNSSNGPIDIYQLKNSFGDNWEVASGGQKLRLINSYWKDINWNNQSVITVSTCSARGQSDFYCSICQEYLHKSSTPPKGHSNPGWIVDKEPTCLAEGQQHFICEMCNATVTENIDIINHTYNDWEIIRGSQLIPPIVREKSCSMCGDTLREEDWGYIWVTILAGFTLIGVTIGVISYIKAFKKKT